MSFGEGLGGADGDGGEILSVVLKMCPWAWGSGIASVGSHQQTVVHDLLAQMLGSKRGAGPVRVGSACWVFAGDLNPLLHSGKYLTWIKPLQHRTVPSLGSLR